MYSRVITIIVFAAVIVATQLASGHLKEGAPVGFTHFGWRMAVEGVGVDTAIDNPDMRATVKKLDAQMPLETIK